MSEAEFAAALSFHYNTGKINSATWVKDVKVGKREKGRLNIMNWRRPAEIIPRRQKERDLFFEGKWANNGAVTEYAVSKPSYTPDWSSAKKVDITEFLESGQSC